MSRPLCTVNTFNTLPRRTVPNPFHDERRKLNIGPGLPRVSVGVKIAAFTSLCDAPACSPLSLMTCCHEKCGDPSACLCPSPILTFSNSPSDSELIWLYKCTQLPRDLDTGTRDISISQTDVILITLNCLTLCCGFTCFLFLCGIQPGRGGGGGGGSGEVILSH